MSTQLQDTIPQDMNAKVDSEIQQPKSSITYSPKIPTNYWDHSLNMNYLKALKELIDNSLNNRQDGNKLTFIVQHFLDSDNNLTNIRFHDDGKGVDVDDEGELDGWIGVKVKKTTNQLSAHGVGMKHSLAAFDGTQGVRWVASNHQTAGYCGFDSICSDMKLHTDDRFWEDRPKSMKGTGMSASVNYNQSNVVVPKKIGDALTIMGELGATYRYYLESTRLGVCFEWVHADGTTNQEWITPKTRPYVTNGKAEPIYNRTKIEAKDKSWEILLTYGKNGKSEEVKKVYPYLLESEVKHIFLSKGRHPYASSSKKTGIDLVEHDRVIELNAKHIISQYEEETGESLGEDKMTRAEWVGYGGEVVLVKGFETTETKEIKHNLAYRQMCNAVHEFLNGENSRRINHFKWDSSQSIISGNQWRDAVSAFLTEDDAHFANKKSALEDPITGYNMAHDIRIDNLPIECKACEIDFSHISKFRSQLEIENLAEGWIVTSIGISADAEKEVQRLKGLTNPINIEIKDWSGKSTRVLQILNEN